MNTRNGADDAPTQALSLSQSAIDAELQRLLAEVRSLLDELEDGPRRRALVALIERWNAWSPEDVRFQAAAVMLTLDQRDVWFMTGTDPVAAIELSASRLLVAIGDAVTAAGANFSFDATEPYTPTRWAHRAYLQLGEAIEHWKQEVLAAHATRLAEAGTTPPVPASDPRDAGDGAPPGLA
jgi:hypothetical protein